MGAQSVRAEWRSAGCGGSRCIFPGILKDTSCVLLLHSSAHSADRQPSLHPSRCSPVTWDITFPTHPCALKTHTPSLSGRGGCQRPCNRPSHTTYPCNAPPSTHTQRHTRVHVTHAHPPPNTTHRSPRTCAPSEPPVLCPQKTQRPPAPPCSIPFHPALAREDCAAKATRTTAPFSPRPRPPPSPPALERRVRGGPCGRSAPRRYTRGCTRPGPPRIDPASHRELGRRWGCAGCARSPADLSRGEDADGGAPA